MAQANTSLSIPSLFQSHHRNEQAQPSQNQTQNVHNNAAAAKTSPKKATKGRSEAPNCSSTDVTALLDIVKKMEPIEANIWAVVEQKFELESKDNFRPSRDIDSLKNKFNKLCNAKKPTGDPSCPPNVRLAKHIARDIQSTIAAKLVGDEESDVEETDAQNDIGCDKETSDTGIGVCEKYRPISQAGIHAKKPKMEDIITSSIESMTKFMGIIATSMSVPEPISSTMQNQEVVIQQTVHTEVAHLNKTVNETMTDTKTMIVGLNAAVQALVGTLSSTVVVQMPQRVKTPKDVRNLPLMR